MTFRRHLRAFEKHTGLGPDHRLLDVGAYLGVFVEVAVDRGWDAWGLELSRWAVDVAQSRGLNMVRARLEDEPFEKDHFDALTLWDVIEHVTDPKGTLEGARNCLRPGGWIAVHTMDLDSLFARLSGRRWPWLMEMHLYYFGRRTLQATLEAAGFVDVSIRAHGRHLRLAYLATRLRRLSPRLASLLGGVLRVLRLDRLAVPTIALEVLTLMPCARGRVVSRTALAPSSATRNGGLPARMAGTTNRNTTTRLRARPSSARRPDSKEILVDPVRIGPLVEFRADQLRQRIARHKLEGKSGDLQGRERYLPRSADLDRFKQAATRRGTETRPGSLSNPSVNRRRGNAAGTPRLPSAASRLKSPRSQATGTRTTGPSNSKGKTAPEQ